MVVTGGTSVVFAFFRHVSPHCPLPKLSSIQRINFRCDLSRNIYRTIARMIIFPIKRTEHLRGNPVIILRYRIAPERMLRTEQGCIQLLSGDHFHPGAVHQELLFVRIGHHGKFLCRENVGAFIISDMTASVRAKYLFRE